MTKDEMRSTIVNYEALLADLADLMWESGIPDKYDAGDEDLQKIANWLRPYWRADPYGAKGSDDE